MTTISVPTIQYGVCIDGGVLYSEGSVFTDPAEAVELAARIKREDPEELVTIVLWA